MICYIGCSMKSFSRVLSSRFISAAVLVVVLGSLCFSVGEGLQLKPFPVSNLTDLHDSKVPAYDPTNRISQYGPLDVPAQSQKRNKRQTVDFDCPSYVGSRGDVTYSLFLFEYDVADSASTLIVRHADGRAPPFLS